MRRIRGDYLTGTSYTLVLCGKETPWRKFVDWEIKATLDKQQGLIGLGLPSNPSLNGKVRVPDRSSTITNPFRREHQSQPARDPLNQEWLGQHGQLLSLSADLLFSSNQMERALTRAREATTLLHAVQERQPRQAQAFARRRSRARDLWL